MTHSGMTQCCRQRAITWRHRSSATPAGHDRGERLPTENGSVLF